MFETLWALSAYSCLAVYSVSEDGSSVLTGTETRSSNPPLAATLLYVIRRGGIRQALLRKSGNWIRASLAPFLAQLLQGAGVLIVHSIGGI